MVKPGSCSCYNPPTGVNEEEAMRKVLVVDEDDEFRVRLKAYLEKLGFEVMDLAKLAQARELYVKGTFVLVMVDVHTNIVWEGLSWAADIYKTGQRVILLHPHSFRWKNIPILVKPFMKADLVKLLWAVHL